MNKSIRFFLASVLVTSLDCPVSVSLLSMTAYCLLYDTDT